jgi:hypothetical protein
MKPSKAGNPKESSIIKITGDLFAPQLIDLKYSE